MKPTAILALAAALSCSLVGAAAAAAQSDNSLMGKYAFTENQHCLVALAQDGFNTSQQPNTPARSGLISLAHAGVYTFDGRGGVKLDETVLSIDTAAFTGTGEMTFIPQATSLTATTDTGQYEVDANGSVTITLVNTILKYLTGPNAGLTASLDQLVLSGQLSPDKKTLLLSATEPTVTTATLLPSNSFVLQEICNFSGTAVKVGP
jgi:hypothetical protein